jgi:hypothetical protein
VCGTNSDRGKRFFFFQIVKTGFGAHLASCSMGVSIRRPGRDVYHSPVFLYLAPKFRIRGAMRLLFLYAFMTLTGTALCSGRR